MAFPLIGIHGNRKNNCPPPYNIRPVASITVSPSGGLQRGLLGLQLGQLSAEAVHLVLQLLVVLYDVHHLLVGLLLAAGRAVPAEEHPCDDTAGREKNKIGF